MLSKKAEEFIKRVTKRSETLGAPGAPLHYVNLSDVQEAADIAYSEGEENQADVMGKYQPDLKSLFDLFEEVSENKLPPKKPGFNHSNPCVCYIPPSSNESSKFLVAYYHYGISGDSILSEPHWVCHQSGGLKYLNPSHYLELPGEPEKKEEKGRLTAEETSITGKSRSMNRLDNIPNGTYSAIMGGHRVTIHQDSNYWFFDFEVGIRTIRQEITIIVLNGYGYISL